MGGGGWMVELLQQEQMLLLLLLNAGMISGHGHGGRKDRLEGRYQGAEPGQARVSQS